MTEQLSLFGDEVIQSPVKRIGKNEKFEDYESFVQKHEDSTKKTTDDCYTPPAVYEVVKNFAGTLIDLTDRPIVRPFYPGGDYKKFGYPDDCVVIDNPPFSIVSQIAQWYEAVGIQYFLFAPHLTCFDCRASCTILTDASVKYANGAIVKTSFITNFTDEPKVWLCPSLKKQLNDVAGVTEHPTEKKNYPPNAINPGQVGKFLSRGIELKIPKDECVYVTNLDALRALGGGQRIFVGGILFSDRIADELQRHKKGFERDVELSDREKRIIEQLNNKEL